MTEEEKYKQIVSSRQSAETANQQTKKENEEPSGVKTDPPADKGTEEPKPADPGKGATEQKVDTPPEAGGKGTEDPKNTIPSDAQKQQNAMAKMRFENKRLLERVKKLEADAANRGGATQQPEAVKKLSEFPNEDEYRKYLYETMEKQITEKVMKQVQEARERDAELQNGNNELRSSLERAFGAERAGSIYKDLENPESELSQILTDERAEALLDVVNHSKRKAEILAIIQARPADFLSLFELPPDKQKYRLYGLEVAIEQKYAQAKQQPQATQQQPPQAQPRPNTAAGLPTPGAFGTNGTGTRDISGLSTQERIARYKEEMRKQPF